MLSVFFTLYLSVSGLRPIQSLLPNGPPDTTDTRQFRLVFALCNIDGTLPKLSPYKGFRNYVKSKCDEIGIDGYVCRVPLVHAEIVATGTMEQLFGLRNFCDELRVHHFIESFSYKPHADEFTVFSGFEKRRSVRKHVQTGTYSDGKDDEVLSTHSSADTPLMGDR